MYEENGGDIQPHRLGIHDFFGPGSEFQINNTKPEARQHFITDDGTDHGDLVEENPENKHKAAMAESEEAITTTKADIGAPSDGIKALDKFVRGRRRSTPLV